MGRGRIMQGLLEVRPYQILRGCRGIRIRLRRIGVKVSALSASVKV